MPHIFMMQTSGDLEGRQLEAASVLERRGQESQEMKPKESHTSGHSKNSRVLPLTADSIVSAPLCNEDHRGSRSQEGLPRISHLRLKAP